MIRVVGVDVDNRLTVSRLSPIMEEMESVIQFQACVAKVQTLVDGGLRITLDLPESAILQAAQLMECKRLGLSELSRLTHGEMINGDGTLRRKLRFKVEN